MTKPSVLPFLMFQGEASVALDFYLSVFPDGRIDELDRYGRGEAGAEGTIRRARFTLGDQSILCTDSAVTHDFGFTPAISFLIECTSEQQVRDLARRLADGGFELMPVGQYGFSRLFAWVQDRFGLNWQCNLA